MRKNLFHFCFFIFAFSMTNNLFAQVTIGSELPPSKGCILDMKEYAPDSKNTTSTKGLLLPRVILKDEYSLEGIVNGNISKEEKESHTGLVVFSLTNPILGKCPGIFVWNGSKWIPLSSDEKECWVIYDAEGNKYPVKKFGSKYWMTKNLRSLMISDTEFIDETNGVRINIRNKGYALKTKEDLEQQVSYIEDGVNKTESVSVFTDRFGMLYSRSQVGKVCPKGWALPTNADWDELAKLMGGKKDANNEFPEIAKKLKSDNFSLAGSIQWNPDAAADGSDNSGFNGFPCGYVSSYALAAGSFGSIGFWWTATNNTRYMEAGHTTLRYRVVASSDYHSVRCVKNAE